MQGKMPRPSTQNPTNEKNIQIPNITNLSQDGIPKINLGDIANLNEILKNINKLNHINMDPNPRSICNRIPKAPSPIKEDPVVDELLAKSSLYQYTFNPDWYEEYFKTQFRPEQMKCTTPNYARIVELRDYLNRKNPRHPNPADIIEFFRTAKGSLKDNGILVQIGSIKKFFTWISHKQDSNGHMMYPDIIGLRPECFVVNPMIRILNQKVRSEQNPNARPTLDLLTDFIKDKTQNGGNVVINLETFLEYLKNLFHISEPEIKKPSKKAKR